MGSVTSGTVADGSADLLAEVDAMQARGDRPGAIERLIEALARSPDQGALADRLVLLYAADGRIDLALEVAWTDLISNGGNTVRWSRAAEMASSTGDAERAVQAARKAVEVGGGRASDWAQLASLAFRHNRLDVAESAARAAVESEPQLRGPRRLLASILSRLDRGEELVKELAAAAKAEPNDAGLRQELSSAYALSGRLAEALEEGRRAIALDPANTTYPLALSGICSQLGHSDEAIALLRSVVERVPEDPRAHYSLGHVLWAKGDQDGAIFHAAQAASLSPMEPGYQDHYLALLEQRAVAPPSSRGAGAAPRSLLASLQDPDAAHRPPPGPMTRWARVIYALMLRDMRTRHASSRLGFAWAIAEPLLHLAALAGIFAIFNRGRPPLGENWFFFYATGVIPFLMWSHITTNGFYGLISNIYVLQIPVIGRLDVLLASALVELATAAAVGVAMFWAFWMVGAGPLPRDPLAVVGAVAVLWLFAFALSLVNASIETVNGSWVRFWPTLVRFQYFASGIFYIPQEMPFWLRDVLVLNPMLQCLEWFRTGFFDQYAPPWLDREYTVVATLVLLLFGMIMEAALRRHRVR